MSFLAKVKKSHRVSAAPNKKLMMELEELESEYGDSSTWSDAIFDGFDFWSAFQAGHFFAGNKEDKPRVEKLLKSIKSSKLLDDVLWQSGADGIPEVFDDKKEAGKYKIPKGFGYFSDAFPDGLFELSAFGIYPFDLALMEKKLKSVTKK